MLKTVYIFPFVKTPRDFLVDCLLARGCRAIRSSERNLNRLAIKLQRGELGLEEGEFHGHVVEEHRAVRLLAGAGGEVAKLRAGRGGEHVDLGIELEFPKIVIDYGLWDYHTREERKLLLKQSSLALQVVRDHLWDRNLVLASCPDRVAEHFRSLGFFGDILPDRYEGKAVLLDPHATEELRSFGEGVYILGGIVDKSNRMRTQELGYELPRVSLKLHGRSSGVPDRLNLLVGIICRNVLGEPLDLAIRRVTQR